MLVSDISDSCFKQVQVKNRVNQKYLLDVVISSQTIHTCLLICSFSSLISNFELYSASRFHSAYELRM
jgi:hypothetical protein